MTNSIFKGLSNFIGDLQNDPSEILKKVPRLDFTPKVVQSAFVEYDTDMRWTTPVKGEFRIVNSSTNEVIDGGNTVSKHYKPHSVREILQSLCDISSRASLVLTDVAILGGGEHIVLRASSGKSFAPRVGDIYSGDILFKISNVPGIISSCSGYVLRLVCLNGATTKDDLGGDVLNLHHRRNYDEAARETVEKLSQSLEISLKGYEEKLEILYSSNTNPDEVSFYYRRLLEMPEDLSVTSRTLENLIDTEMEQPGGLKTHGSWAHPYNAVTYWVDHVRGRKPESALFSTLYGNGERLKRKALDLAVKMAKGL